MIIIPYILKWLGCELACPTLKLWFSENGGMLNKLLLQVEDFKHLGILFESEQDSRE